MMQPRPPAAARVPEPSGRKRKRPQSSKHVDDAASPESETEDEGHAAGGTTKPKLIEPQETKKEEEPQSESRGAEATIKDEASGLSRPFRGKCLYQSRKCENERALKRNGKAHNLCEEHRSKQNQHQRKFDAKKYSRRKRKRSISGDEEEQHDDEDEHEHEEPPAKRPAVGQGAPDELLQRTAPSISMPILPRDTRPLVARRPPPLLTARSPTANAFPLPRSPRVPTFTPSPQTEILAASILVPPPGAIERARSYASPHGHSHASALPQPRSRSFDMGVTRISPVGGAAFVGSGPQFSFVPQRLASQDARAQQNRGAQSFAPSGRTENKLPSLQQLPLAGLTRRSPPPTTPSLQFFHSIERPPPQSYQQHSPHHQVSYYEQLPPQESRGVAYARPAPPHPPLPGRVLPSLATIARPMPPPVSSSPSGQPRQPSPSPLPPN